MTSKHEGELHRTGIFYNFAQTNVKAMAKKKKVIVRNRIQTVLDNQGRKQTWLRDVLEEEGHAATISTINRWCTNDVQPTLSILDAIAVILDVKMDTLLVKNSK